jgi:hypothetical protein
MTEQGRALGLRLAANAADCGFYVNTRFCVAEAFTPGDEASTIPRPLGARVAPHAALRGRNKVAAPKLGA